jgi:hypothetical protein
MAAQRSATRERASNAWNAFHAERMLRFLRRAVAALRNWLRPLSPPEEPYAAVRQPRGRNPAGRNSAVAVAEPDARESVRAVGRSAARTNRADSEKDPVRMATSIPGAEARLDQQMNGRSR